MPIVCVTGRCIRFFRSSMTTAQTGPNANAPISAGSSAKSNFKNTGMNGSGISRYMRRTAIAVRIAVAAIRRIMILRAALESVLTVK